MCEKSAQKQQPIKTHAISLCPTDEQKIELTLIYNDKNCRLVEILFPRQESVCSDVSTDDAV